MNSKIALPDLVELLAQKAGCTKKDAELFLKEFFGLASEVISKGETLKINGLGVFKIVWVEKRSSVNIQTGLPFEIPGHYKLTFSPDENLKEAVNAPFSCFETEILPDDVMTDAVVTAMDDDDDDNVLDFEETEVEDVCEETVSDSGSESSVCPESKETSYTLPEVESLSEAPSEAPQEESSAPLKASPDLSRSDIAKEFKHRFRLGYLSGFLSASLLASLIILGWLYFDKVDTYKEMNLTMHPMTVTIKKDKMGIKENKDSLTIVEMMVTDSIKATAVVHQKTIEAHGSVENVGKEKDSISSRKPDSVAVRPQEKVPDKIKTPVTEVMKPGIFLTTISLKHYGHKTFWVYIYEENKAKIENPNNVPIGTVLVIPDAEKYGINSGSKESVAKAKALAEKILRKYEE